MRPRSPRLRASCASSPASRCFRFLRIKAKSWRRWSLRSRECFIRWNSRRMSQLNYKESTVGRARRVVIKVGSAVLSDVEGLRVDVIDQLAAQIELAVRAGQEVVIVTSGAVAAGRARLSKLKGATIAARQAAAATGQIDLMSAWARA